MYSSVSVIDVAAELQGREERSKQYFDKVLNGVGGSEADELLNEVFNITVFKPNFRNILRGPSGNLRTFYYSS